MFFGNGHGMAEPCADGVFYWLVDRNHRDKKKGRFYKYTSGFGAQLRSFEWIAPKAGTSRKLAGYDFYVFHSIRGRFGLMHCVSWSVENMPKDLDKKHELIKAIKRKLDHPR